MDISRFEVFLNVVETRSFSRVALQLGYTQSGVSHMMRSLENEMGFPLFIRTKDGVTLTKDGEKIVPAVRTLFNANRQLEEGISEITGLKSGMLRIGAHTSITVMILLPILKKFHKDFSRIHYDIVDGPTAHLSRLLSENQIDIGFFSKVTDDRKFKYYPIMEDEIVALVPPDSPYAKRKSFHLTGDIQGAHLLVPNMDGEEEVAQIVRKSGVHFDDTFATNDTYGAMSMVEKGMGVALISHLVLKSHPVNVVSLPLEVPQYRTLGMFVPANASLSPSTKKFMSYCQQMIPSIVAEIKR